VSPISDGGTVRWRTRPESCHRESVARPSNRSPGEWQSHEVPGFTDAECGCHRGDDGLQRGYWPPDEHVPTVHQRVPEQAAVRYLRVRVANRHRAAYATATTYLSEPPGSFEIVVTSAGSKTIVLDDSLETVPGGTVRTSIALDHPGGGAPLTALNLANAG